MKSDSTPADGSRRGRRGEGVLPWILIAIAMFVVYAASFSGYPAIEREISVVGETDAASYIRLWRGFRFDRPVGNPYALETRTLDDVAEKHRIHHVLSAATGHVLAGAFSRLYSWLGIPRRQAPFAVNAFWGGLNILLLGFLLRRWNPPTNPVWPFLVLYGVSMSPWLYSAMPDSWPLTTCLLLTFLHLTLTPRIPAAVAAMALGGFMLNNMALGTAILFLWLVRSHENPGWRGFVLRATLLGGITVATWVGSLTLLSLADPSYRLDRFLAYSAWFREFMGATLPPWDPYVWKSILTNLFVSSFVSNQSDPNMPQEAVLYTLRGSWLGRAAVAAVVALFAVTGYQVWRAMRAWREQGRSVAELAVEPALTPLWFCGAMVAVTYALYYAGGFTYSTLVVPMIATLQHRFLDLGRPADRWIMWVGLAIIVVNNVAQIAAFRSTLAALG